MCGQYLLKTRKGITYTPGKQKRITGKQNRDQYSKWIKKCTTTFSMIKHHDLKLDGNL